MVFPNYVALVGILCLLLSASINAAVSQDERLKIFKGLSNDLKRYVGTNGKDICLTKSEARESGALLYRYVLGDEIARGTEGQVFQAEDKCTDGLVVAIKRIFDGDAEEETQKAAAIKEQDIHDVILRNLNVFTLKTRKGLSISRTSTEYIVMPMMRGTLQLENHNLPAVRDIIKQVVEAILAVHKANFVYTDLKPENILVKSSEPPIKIQLADFGLSFPEDTETAGNFPYYPLQKSAPYFYHINKKSDDIYAIGRLTMDLYTGKRLASGDNRKETMIKLISLGHGQFDQDVEKDEAIRRLIATNALEAGIESRIDKTLANEKNDDPDLHRLMVDFIKRCVQRDPSKRPLVKELLQDPFFETKL
eukprot:Partr_v1_DN28475_c3_g1_i1_m41859